MLLSRAEKQLCFSVSVTAPILCLKSENRGVESVEHSSPVLPFPSSHELFLVCVSADVYFSWHVLAGTQAADFTHSYWLI